MFKIYAKLITDNKVKADYVYELKSEFTIHDFFEYVQEICANLDIPTPIILTKHIKNFLIFDNTIFTEPDFIESFPYDKFAIEIFK